MSPADFIFLFRPVRPVVTVDEITREHAIVFDAYRHAHALPAWMRIPAGSPLVPSMADMNSAVEWWNNRWNETGN